MKNSLRLLPVLVALILVFACNPLGDSGKSGNKTEPEKKEPLEPENIELNDKVAGKVALSYVTYYGSRVPEAASLTHINYAFAELYVRDNVYTGFKVQGTESRFKTIVNVRKAHPELKMLLSFTHGVSNSDNWQDGGFSAVARDPENRRKFAEDCLAFIEKWGIDGIDLDWEFPGLSWSGAACDPLVDTDNFTLLVKQLRETLGPGYLLTYAGYCMDKQKVSSGGYRYIDIKAVDPYVDWVNIMTYDLDAAPHAHNALKNSNTYVDCDRAVKAYVEKGIDGSKLVLGIPAYGRHSFSSSPGTLKYGTILALGNDYKVDNWDNASSVPYVTYKGQYWCSYDNPKSIAIKGDWIRSKGMKGMMLWEYDEDSSKGTLRKSLWNAVMQ